MCDCDKWQSVGEDGSWLMSKWISNHMRKWKMLKAMGRVKKLVVLKCLQTVLPTPFPFCLSQLTLHRTKLKRLAESVLCYDQSFPKSALMVILPHVQISWAWCRSISCTLNRDFLLLWDLSSNTSTSLNVIYAVKRSYIRVSWTEVYEGH